jgi:hypothetical protein
MSSPTFKEALGKSGVEATVTYIAPTQVAAKLIFTVVGRCTITPLIHSCS